jgi:hypothetical protein
MPTLKLALVLRLKLGNQGFYTMPCSKLEYVLKIIIGFHKAGKEPPSRKGDVPRYIYGAKMRG